MKRTNLLAMAVLAVMIMGTGLVTNTNAATTVKLGLLTPKSGALGFLGQSFEDGAKLAISDLNEMQSDFTFELIVQDTATDPQATVTVTNSLVADGVVGIVGAAASSNTLAAISIASDNQIPMISYASTSPSLTTEEDGDYLFRVVPSDAYQGQALAKMISDDGYSKVAIVALDDPYGQGLANSFKEAFSGTVSVEQSYSSDQKDFVSIVTQVKNSDAEAILTISFNDDGVLLYKELATQGVNLPTYGADGIKSDKLFEAENFEGTKGTEPEAAGANDEFVTKFNTTYEYEPTIFVPQAYDATMILGKAVIEAGEAVGCKVADNIRIVGNEYAGVSGTITFDKYGDQIYGKYNYWKADNGSFVSLGTYTADTSGAEMGNTNHCDTAESGGIPFNTFGMFFGLFTVATFVFVRRRK